ncbi:MAG: NYN domain-containing protein [Alphaproteobacteria bacterium]|nr:MAG: NYN domain-containing protein [Alphaproteobacteria bacterium]
MRNAIVFVDWDTARRLGPRHKLPAKNINAEARRIDDAFAHLRQVVADTLASIDPREVFRVRWRLYHGWFSGQTKTDDFRAVEAFRADLRTTTIGKISFGADLTVATSMLCGGPRMPLYDTLRAGIDAPGEFRQKMVDTGLVGDLLQSARSAGEDVHVVIADDDDLLPGLFMAEAWGVKVLMLRQQAPSTHLKTSGLWKSIRGVRYD